jgi:hypothetical protein
MRDVLDDRVWDGSGWPIRSWAPAELQAMYFRFEPPDGERRSLRVR